VGRLISVSGADFFRLLIMDFMLKETMPLLLPPPPFVAPIVAPVLPVLPPRLLSLFGF
jgi:hypothetical protein